ncbi:MAG: 5'-nucleotidase C-terminal domain-containing protein, partial [Alphaproteobacteria bacterium]|nr:5'-nucleotidase C-terminal domain-containing protein [Alphaproteobacteria bacterium]
MGILNTTFDKKGRITTYAGDTVRLDDTVVPDEMMTQKIALAQKGIDKIINEPIINITQDIHLTNHGRFCSESCYVGEFLTHMLKQFATDADIALLNAGGIRAGMPSGQIAFKHIASAYPFDSKGVLVKMTGQELLDYIEFGLKDYIPNDRTNAFLQIAGGQYTFDAVTKQVTSLTIAEKPVQSNASYFVILPSFLAEGGDGFPKKSV